MKTALSHLTAALIVGAGLNGFAQSTAITYQGRLDDAAGAVTGRYDLRFALYDDTSNGTQWGPPLTNAAVLVSNGLFTTTLDFGSGVFTGGPRWLEIGVRTNGVGGFTTLIPRQPLTPAPYAIMARSASNLVGTLPASQLSDTVSDARLSANVALLNANQAFSGVNGFLGNVGIGTTTPNQKLQIVGPDNSSIDLVTGSLTLRSSVNSVAGAAVGTVSSHDLTLFTGNLPREVITAAGKVGIGKTAPATALDVNGTVTATGFQGDGGGLVNLNATTLGGAPVSGFWQTGGNGGTAAGQFLGTTDNKSLMVKVNNTTALLIAPTATVPNIVGGMAALRPTVIASNVRGAVVAGGNAPSGGITGAGAGDFHAVYDTDGTIGGGFGNKVGTDDGNPDSAPFATVAGGIFNFANNYAATVAGGDSNLAGGTQSAVGGGAGNQALGTQSIVGGGANNQAKSGYSTVGGGSANVIGSNAQSATIPGGESNGSEAIRSTIGGGWQNTIGLDAWESVLAGGSINTIRSNAPFSTLSGGRQNLIGAGASFGIIPGGVFNEVNASLGLAAGNRAKANHQGAFVWADSQNADFASTAADQFAVRAAGGAVFSMNNAAFQVQGSALISKTATTRATARQFAISHTGDSNWGLNLGYVFNPGVEAAGVIQALDAGNPAWLHINPAGGQVLLGSGSEVSWGDHYFSKLTPDQGGSIEVGNSLLLSAKPYIDFHYGVNGVQDYNVRLVNDGDNQLTCTGNFRAQTLTPLSDRNAKENFAAVDPQEVLQQVAALPISRWTFKTEAGVKHVGPMAQDFHAAFGVGADDKHIATVDADGVALAAIQGLNQKLEEQRAENAELKARLDRLEKLIAQESIQSH
jgi:hypothetical protein